MTVQHLLLAWVLPDLVLWGTAAVVLVAWLLEARGQRK